MDDAERAYIIRNLPKLLTTTICNAEFLSCLVAEECISMLEKNTISEISDGVKQADKLYTLLITRANGYSILQKCLQKTCQTGAYSILSEFVPKNVAKANTNDAVAKDVAGSSNISSINASKNVTPSVTKKLNSSASKGTQVKTVGMEPWQRYCIHTNLDKLAANTKCSAAFWKPLVQHGIINDCYIKFLEGCGSSKEKTFYQTKFIDPRTYECILSALQETGQQLPLQVLEDAREINKQWLNMDTKVSNTDFKALSSAIAHHCSVEALKSKFPVGSESKPLYQKGKQGETLLHIAVGCGHNAVVKHLISLKMNVNSADNDGFIPIHYVGKWSSNMVETTKSLLENKANIDAKDKSGKNVAHIISERVLTPTAYHSWVKAITDMVDVTEKQNPFKKRDTIGDTAIHKAMEHIDLKCETVNLVKSQINFDFNTINHNGDTILLVSIAHTRSLDTIKSVMNCGASIKIVNKEKQGVLHLSVKTGVIDTLRHFLSLKANIEARDILGQTPLHYIAEAETNHIEMTKLLIENGVDMYAINNGEDNVAHLFGAKINKAVEYMEWIKFLKESGHEKLLQMKNKKGARPSTFK